MADPVTATIAVVGSILKLGSMVQASDATNTAINEAIEDYSDQKIEVQARTQAAWQATTANMKDTAAGNIFQVGNVARQAQQATGAFKAQQGYAGVRGNSPLLALKQQETIGLDAVSEAQRAADAQLKALGRETSLLTQGYQRQIALLTKKSQYLETNREQMKSDAFWKGAPQFVDSLDWKGF